MITQIEVGGSIFKCGIADGLQGFADPVGFFEAPIAPFDPSVYNDAFLEIESWVKSQNVKTIIGPFSGNTLFPYRFRTSHFSEKAFWGEPENNADIVSWLGARGYIECAIYTSSRVINNSELGAKISDLRKNLPTASIQDFSVIVCDKIQWHKFEKEIYELTLEAFKSNFLFKIYSFQKFHHVYDPLFASGAVSSSSLLLMVNNRPVGFCFNFEDTKNTYLKTIGVHPDFRRLGAGFLYLMTESYLRSSPKKDLVLCLMKQGNLPDLFSSSMVKEKRSYALFQKSF